MCSIERASGSPADELVQLEKADLQKEILSLRAAADNEEDNFEKIAEARVAMGYGRRQTGFAGSIEDQRATLRLEINAARASADKLSANIDQIAERRAKIIKRR